jgi:hypothetical protein
MTGKYNLIAKVSAFIFLALAAWYGFNLADIVIAGVANPRGFSIPVIIDAVIRLVYVVSFAVTAIGCFLKSRGALKAGLGIIAVASVADLVFVSLDLAYHYQTYFLRDRLVPFYCYAIPLGLMAYGLLLLMAVRVPVKAHILGILAAAVCLGFFIYNIAAAAGEDHVPFFQALFSTALVSPVLLTGGAVTLGLWYHGLDSSGSAAAQASGPESGDPSGTWTCPGCKNANPAGTDSCRGCGRQR